MNKQEKHEKSLIITLAKNNKQAYKASKINAIDLHCVDEKDFEVKVNICKELHLQNILIDLCAYNKKTFTETQSLLVMTNLCKSLEHASSRMKRHYASDINTAKSKRYLAFKEKLNSYKEASKEVIE
jgi:hypothetical protein